MKKTACGVMLLLAFIVFFSSSRPKEPLAYIATYKERVVLFQERQHDLLDLIKKTPTITGKDADLIRQGIRDTRLKLKELDFWLRYFEPIAYKKINGPLPVEWETEVFEKYEAPYKREGAGLTLAQAYLDEEDADKDSLQNLISASLESTNVFLQDSITSNLNTYHHFFLANRLFLLNLAAVYTTGFECPDTESIIPELTHMLSSVSELYSSYEYNFPTHPVKTEYLDLFEKTIHFVKNQSPDYTAFDHFRFIKDFVNPLYQLNAEMILNYKVRSASFNDFALNKYVNSIFDKALYRGQNSKGVFIGITDENELAELKSIGKMLFYDPILSGNNKRSCASCHKPTEYFTDTTATSHLRFDRKDMLARNTPSLVNAVHNHLLMMDGKHINLENQALDVITNPAEMGSTEKEALEKVLSCGEYKSVFKKYLKATPQYKTINIEHLSSALMLYYSDFSNYYAPFDLAIRENKPVSEEVVKGFNLFMSKAQCGTCHFVPQFNGVKPPYVGSEFEVLGVPADTGFTKLSTDKGRYNINPAKETAAAFRTGSVRNAAYTKPYMHNGVFRTLEEVIDFYDAGGGAGRGLNISNQTLSSDSLKLTKNEKKCIIAFINSLNEEFPLQVPPVKLPVSRNKELNSRIVGGEY
jgi:cytochrome c peroxidase